jgi:hypothetical protein
MWLFDSFVKKIMLLLFQVGLFTEIGPLSCFISRHVSLKHTHSSNDITIIYFSNFNSIINSSFSLTSPFHQTWSLILKVIHHVIKQRKRFDSFYLKDQEEWYPVDSHLKYNWVGVYRCRIHVEIILLSRMLLYSKVTRYVSVLLVQGLTQMIL